MSASKGRTASGNLGRAIAAATALVGLLSNPEVQRVLSAASGQTKKWAAQVKQRMASERFPGARARSLVTPKHDPAALLRRLDALAAAAADIAPLNAAVADEVLRQERELRAKVTAARRLPAELRKPKLKDLAAVVAALEQQLATALG
ncbi:MAG: hypothetical protein Q7V57_13495 [Actinomycetota bacterium]|nr:hypothetical protein [Actinomycetota bacterium]